jgi:flavin-dependent dehydrogenase
MNSAYDCIVVGGGPAGCTTATLLAQAGWTTLLLEAEKIPRVHVGESLMPESHRTLERLGVLEQLKNSAFIRKNGIRFVSQPDNESHSFHYRDHDPRESSTTWQVERADFDKLLFDNAAQKGADCRDQSCVAEVTFAGDRACGVRIQTPKGFREVQARVIVDATGQQTFLAHQLNLRAERSGRSNVAIWGYYRNALRDEGDDAGDTIVFRTVSKRSWFWFIPLTNNVTSIGVIGDQSQLLQNRGEPAALFEDELVDCPALTERLLNAQLVGELRMLKQFSYCTTQRSGHGWVLVGDAGGFADPLCWSGVFLALKSGELAADAVDAALKQNDLSPAALGRWTPTFDNGVRWLRRLGDALHAPDFDLSQLLRDHPDLRGDLTDLLMGRVIEERAARLFETLEMTRK